MPSFTCRGCQRVDNSSAVTATNYVTVLNAQNTVSTRSYEEMDIIILYNVVVF